MKQISWILYAFLYSSALFAQVEPTQNNDAFLHEHKVKTVSTTYTDSDGKEHLILKKEYSPDGKLTQKYLLSLWEAVSYSNTTTFQYNEKEQLVETINLQTILNLNERDDEFISSFGAKPLNEKYIYTYNEDGQLSQRTTYNYNTDKLPNDAKPNQTVEYTYDSDLLQSEKIISPQSGIFSKNQTTIYTYDNNKNLIQKVVTYGKDMDLERTTKFVYDAENRVSEEKIKDTSIPRNNNHFKYIYDSLGHLSQKLVFDAVEEGFVELASYEYDDHGQQISGDRETEFTYYENGLIRSEKWKDEISDEIFVFTTQYDFY